MSAVAEETVSGTPFAEPVATAAVVDRPVAPASPLALGSAIGRAAAVSAGAQVVAKVLHLVFNVVSTLAIVRYLAPGEYGVYAVVLTVTTLISFGADFGLPKIAVREIAAAPDDVAVEERVIGTAVLLRIVLAIAAIGVSQCVLLAMHQPTAAYPAAAVASLTGVGEAVVVAVVVIFQMRLAQHYEAWVRASTEFLETAATLLLVSLHASLVWLFVPPTAGSALAAGIVLLLARYRFRRRLRFDSRRARSLLLAALPVAPALVLGALYRKMDSLALAVLRPSRDVGIYSSAAQPVEYAFLSTALLMNVAFPLMAAAHGQGDLQRFARVYRRGAEALILITLVLPVLLLFVGRPLAVHVFGRAYATADLPLLLLSTAMVPLVISVWQSLALLLGGHQKVTLYYNIATLTFSVAASTGLVAAFGIVGAGVAAIVTGCFVLAASTVAVRRLMHVRLAVGPLLRIAAAALAAGAVLTLLSLTLVPWPATAALGLLAYCVATRLVGAHRSLTGVVS